MLVKLEFLGAMNRKMQVPVYIYIVTSNKTGRSMLIQLSANRGLDCVEIRTYLKTQTEESIC